MKLLYVKFTLIITVIALVITIIACNRDSLLKGVNIEVGTELLYNPVNVQIIDGKLDGTIPQNITVSIIGKDKDKIYSVLGEKAITVNSYGILNIGIPRNNTATIYAPIEFMVVINAPGYMEARKNFVVTDLKRNIFEDARMVNLSSPPKGVSISSNVVIPVDAAKGVMEDINFATPSAIGKTENASVKVLAGTKMFDKDGNAVTGDVKVSLVHFDAVNKTSLSCYPGGFSFRGAIDSSGKPVNGGEFYTLGFITLSMSANDKVVKTFSKPINVEAEVNANTFNPVLNRKIQVGDSIPIWSLNDLTGKWTLELYSKITVKNNKLILNYNQTHLSYWNFDFWDCQFGCNSCNNPVITILSDFTETSNNGYYGISIEAPGSPPGVHSHGETQLKLITGSTINPNNYNNSQIGLVINIFDTPNTWAGNLIYSSPVFYPCNGDPLDLRGKLPPLPLPPPTINLNFSAVCAGTTANSTKATIYPSAWVYYHEVGSYNWWQYLGFINNGTGSGSGLIPGKKYKFAIFYGSFSRTTDDLGLKDGFLMPDGDATIAVKSTVYGLNESITIHKNVANNSYDLNYFNYPVPDKLCAEYQKYFK